ncbi:hypothetical protein F5Y18DRAFT_336206 [Xylariaceae sp. FL1019]|nr:hypothetical protein F5Y18DRAFT_336206 [Xylariaceae sp. FL1019]
MGQYWEITNVDQKQVLSNRGGLKLGEILLNGTAEQLLELLTVPNLSEVKVNHAAVDLARTINAASRLVTLPQEVVDSIMANLHGRCQLIPLALTCSYFWRVLLPRLRECIIASASSWAGDRLVFVGDYAHGVPSSCRDLQDPDDTYDQFNPPNPLYDLGPEVRPPLSTDALLDTPRLLPIADEERQRLRRLLAVLSSGKTPQPGVLRNLSKHEYVMDAKLAASRYAYSLGEAAIIRAAWCPSDGGDDEWAGDRFDIRTMDHITDEWTDKSDEMIEFFEAVTWTKSDGRRSWVI